LIDGLVVAVYPISVHQTLRTADLFISLVILIISALSIHSSFAGRTAATSAPQSQLDDSTIVIHLPGEPASLDWNLANRRIDSLVINSLQEGLIEAGPHHKTIAVLAKSWEISAEGQTYTFHIRDDVRWSDGKLLVAQHFVDSWKRLLSPLTSTSNGYFLSEVLGAENYRKGKDSDFSNVAIKALSSSTIQIKLKRPLRNWIWNFAESPTFPIRQDLIDRFGAKSWATPGNMVTLGPYILVSHDLDAGYTLRRNPRYFRASSLRIREADYKILSDIQAEQDFINHKLDLICYLSDTKKLPRAALPFLRWSEANTTKRLEFNTQRFPLSNPDIREAIASVIDRQKLTSLLGQGFTVGTSAAPTSMSTHLSKGGAQPDPIKARETLRDAHIDSLSLEILVPMFDEHAEVNIRTAEAIQKILVKELHADVTIQRAETEQLYTLLRDTQQYSLLLRDWTGTNDPDEFYAFYASFSKKSTTWSSGSYDKILEESRAEKSATKRAALYRQLDSILTTESFAVIPLFYSSDGMLVSHRVLGFNAKDAEPCKIKNLRT
jgi:ABC-type oligopeptide transport system substrate-binding subunit